MRYAIFNGFRYEVEGMKDKESGTVKNKINYNYSIVSMAYTLIKHNKDKTIHTYSISSAK